MNYSAIDSKMYYINNTFWKDKLPNDLDDLRHFKNIKYNDIIIFNFDFLYSLMKTKIKTYEYVFIDAINVCLRYYNLIKKMYPYNNVNIVIWFDEYKIKKLHLLKINYDTFKKIIDIVPNFAIFDLKNVSEINNIDNEQHKHIFYGSFLKVNLKISEKQSWNAINGQLIIRPKF